MNGHKRVFRSQSAMEYLMTYGWAILIISVVLAVLFSLNVFNAGASLGTACIGQPGYSCTQPLITSGGLITFTIGSGTGSSVTDAWFACAGTGNSVSASSLVYNAIYQNGQVSGASYSGIAIPGVYPTVLSNTIANGAQITVQGVQCYPAKGGITNMLSPIGSSFSGSIWMVYTTSGSSWSPAYIQIATVTAKSSS